MYDHLPLESLGHPKPSGPLHGRKVVDLLTIGTGTNSKAGLVHDLDGSLRLRRGSRCSITNAGSRTWCRPIFICLCLIATSGLDRRGGITCRSPSGSCLVPGNWRRDRCIFARLHRDKRLFRVVILAKWSAAVQKRANGKSHHPLRRFKQSPGFWAPRRHR